MPGIIGLVTRPNDASIEEIAMRMIESMRHRPDYKVEKWTDTKSGISLSRVGCGILNPIDQPIKSRDGAISLVFDGELYENHNEGDDAAYIIERYKKGGEGAFESLQGIFVGCIFDRNRSEVILFNDKFGLKPVYYFSKDGLLCFASEVKALLQCPAVSKDIDHQAFADCFRYGFVLGNKTLLKDIRLLPPGSTLTFDLGSRTYSLRPYWDNLSLFNGGVEGVSSVDLVELFIRSTQKRLRKKDILGISLSGGLDSRGILAALQDEAKDMPSYTLGLRGCQDQALSQRMAGITGTRHEFIEITEDDLKDFKALGETLIYLSDGMYFPHESTERVAMNYFKRAPFRILFRGHGGELAKASLAYPVQVTREALLFKTARQSEEFIYHSANLVMRDLEEGRIFTPEFLKGMRDGARASLGESLRKVEGTLSPPDHMIYFYLNEHVRRQVVASLEIFRSEIEVRLPYLDEDFLGALFKLPIQERYEGEIQIEIVKRTQPTLLKVPNSNTGAPLDAGRLRLMLTDKLNSALKRLSLKGYRHYTEFDKWQRKYFRSGIEEILFDDKTLERGVFLRDGLRSAFEAHVSGKKNYAHFLGTAVGLELWFRRFLD